MPSVGSVFGDIKSRLGLGAQGRDQGYDEYDDYEEYDEYDEYDEDGYEDGYEPVEDPYRDRNPVTTRSAIGSMPRLVTMDDARESVRSSYGSDAPRSSSVRSYGRTMVDSSLPPAMTSEGTAAVAAASNRRSEGLDSLFSSTARSSASSRPRTTSTALSSDILGSGSASSGSLTTFSGDLRNSLPLSLPGQRQLQVIRPTRYDDAESVTKVLKTGDVAILVFATTADELMKRILDFSFGAASAFDASVECIGNRIFAIARGVPLDDNERADLHNMGVI